MKITFCCTDTKAEPWLQGLAAALPGADITVWAARCAGGGLRRGLGAAPAVHGRAAGAEGPVQHRRGCGCAAQAAPAAPARVVRLDDAGMSVQMAEYVCHAVIRHFREFDGYEADMAAGPSWAYRKPRSCGLTLPWA
jgi:glyoxylate/hydroxypyruvate reductase A